MSSPFFTIEYYGRKKEDRFSGKLLIYKTAGPSSYTSGGFTVTIPNVSRIIAAGIINVTGGYLAEIAGISGNTVTIKVYEFNYPATAAGPATEVAAGTDLSSVEFTLLVIAE